MPKIIEVIYEDGVFKPLEKVEFKNGLKIKIVIPDKIKGRKETIEKYRGIFGRANSEELKKYEGEVML